jgi:hypothetical protein
MEPWGSKEKERLKYRLSIIGVAALLLLVGLPAAQGRDKSKDKDKGYWVQKVEGRRFALADQAYPEQVIDAKNGMLLVKRDAHENGFYATTRAVVIKGRKSTVYDTYYDSSDGSQRLLRTTYTIGDDGDTITEVYPYVNRAERKFTYRWSGPAPD